MSWWSHLFLPAESNNQRAKLLHPSVLMVIIALFGLFQVGLGRATRVYPQILGFAARIPPEEIVRLTNDRRQGNGLLPLKLDSQLSAAAAKKAADMLARDYWAHVSPVGVQPWFFITDSGYAYRYAGENLARDFADPTAVVVAWMDSPTHRDNVLSSRYQDIGVAVIDGKLGGRETTLVVQMFGTRLSATSPPALGSATKIEVQQVKAAEPTTAPVVAAPSARIPFLPQITPFGVTKALSLGLLSVLALVLLADVVVVYRRRIVRWSSKSLAHLTFIGFLIAAVAIVVRGQIL